MTRRTASGQAELLLTVLGREAERGFDNGTVLGGFDEMWGELPDIESAVRSLGPMNGRRYSALLPDERRKWRAALLRNRKRGGGDSRPSPRAKSGVAQVPQGNGVGDDGGDRRRLPRGSGIDTRIADLTQLHHRTRWALEQLGLRTVRDALRYYPTRHIDYSSRTPVTQLMSGVEATVIGDVIESRRNDFTRPPSAVTRIRDGSGVLRVTWFNMPFMANRWSVGDRVVFSGMVGEFHGRPTMTNPEYDDLTVSGREVDRGLVHAGTLVPIYALREGLNQRTVRSGIIQTLEVGLPAVRDAMPDDIREAHGLVTISDAIRRIHTPRDHRELAVGRRRMAFDECLYNQIAALRRRAEWRRGTVGSSVKPSRGAAEAFVAGLDFELTSDQRTALDAVLNDMESGVPMVRLIQGEVGSGKTVVAIAAMLSVVVQPGSASAQAAFLAPTEVLAEQHFLNLVNGLDCVPAFGTGGSIYESESVAVGNGADGRRLRVAMLTGSLSGRNRRDVVGACAAGDVDIVVGTHALLQESVEFRSLALVVVDEQQRFGTEQRATLTKRTPRPHLIAMSATPIPRTQHMALYGEMDVSELTTLPHGRSRIATYRVESPMDAAAAFAKMRGEVERGRQCFVVCPLIEPSDDLEVDSAIETYERLRVEQFAGFKVGLLHGRMPIAEKQQVMERFRLGATQMLVSTTIIEVGLDVPNATAMMVMSAERFGMSQLHQLRGRVGRGEHPGVCYLVGSSESESANERLEALVASSDGFALAMADLEMRGPGKNLASAQSGWTGWRFARFTDLDLILEARSTASDILRQDRDMSSAKFRDLRRSMSRVIVDPPSEFA